MRCARCLRRVISMQASRTSPTAHQNRLLESLPVEDYEQLRPHLAYVKLPYKCPLYEAYEPIEFVYFLENGVASLVNTMADGDAAEVGTVGNEGLVGLPVVFNDIQAPSTVYMQVAGAGLRIDAKLFEQELQRSISIRKRMLHYAHAFFNQVAQSAACNIFHSVEQRCCRWLLMTRERMQSDAFPLTQEFLAMMLGVRRAGVTATAGALKRDGIIDYIHGRVTVLDSVALLKRSCECYGVTKNEFDRLLDVGHQIGNRATSYSANSQRYVPRSS